MDLKTPISKLPFVGPIYMKRMEKLGIFSLKDLLSHIPKRYLDYSLISKINRVQPGEVVTVQGKVEEIKNIYTKNRKKIQKAVVSDETGSIEVTWFNQPFLVRNIPKNSLISLSGKANVLGIKTMLVSPDYEIVKPDGKTIHTGRIVPLYPETRGITSKWLRSRISAFFPEIRPGLEEYLPKEIRIRENLLELPDAYQKIHFPKNIEDTAAAKNRLAFDELLNLHIKSLIRKSEWKETKPSHKLGVERKEIKAFIGSLPFDLTPSQERASREILADLEKGYPMNRLLEGDVGSGKTAVAAIACFTAFLNETQSIIMAPTQILAQQHFVTLNKLLLPYKVRVSLVTSSGVIKDPGRSDIFVGTHSLIHDKVNFEKVSLVVIDEQHRFGVEQRTHLIRKAGKINKAPHVLTMTATPIPRTIALTAYGDLDLSLLTDMPKGRIPIKTWIVGEEKRLKAYDWIKRVISKEKVQVFVVCPLIESSDIETMQGVSAATEEYEKLKEIFFDAKIGLLHGKQKSKEKENTLESFRNGKIDILVATPVVEVGIDVPNATIMIIEGADRFGLAALHQLRGRVGRGKKQSYCLLFTDKKSGKIMSRLSALEKSLSGGELAELDLKLRGPGEVFGIRQHGFDELKIATWHDFELIKKTKEVAKEIVESPIYKDKVLEHLIPNIHLD